MPGELIMIGIYLSTWLLPETMLSFDRNIVSGLAYGMFFQFLFSHAGVGLGIAGLVSRKGSSSSALLIGMALFYSLFFIAFALGTGSYIVIAMFVLILYQNWPVDEKEKAKEGRDRVAMIIVPFLSVMILLLSGISLMIPVPKLGFEHVSWFHFSDIEIEGERDRPERIMMWGIVYYAMLYFFKRFWNKHYDGKKTLFMRSDIARKGR